LDANAAQAAQPQQLVGFYQELCPKRPNQRDNRGLTRTTYA
jgi:hypothetical protein